jgi:hypothetical protein
MGVRAAHPRAARSGVLQFTQLPALVAALVAVLREEP